VLRVLATNAAKGRPEQTLTHHHDRGVDLGNGALIDVGVTLFDDALDRAVFGVHQTSVPRRVVHSRTQYGQRGVAFSVYFQESRHRGVTQQRRVAGQYEHVAVGGANGIFHAGQRRRHCVSRAELFTLLDKRHPHTAPACSRISFSTHVALWPNYDDRGAYVLLSGGVQDVQHHGPTAELVERLGT